MIPNCDKSVPAMLMAAARLNIPSIIVSGGPMLKGKSATKDLDLVSAFEAVGSFADNKITYEELIIRNRKYGLSYLWKLCRNVHSKFYELA